MAWGEGGTGVGRGGGGNEPLMYSALTFMESNLKKHASIQREAVGITQKRSHAERRGRGV